MDYPVLVYCIIMFSTLIILVADMRVNQTDFNIPTFLMLMFSIVVWPLTWLYYILCMIVEGGE